ncbi:hypothetical protein NVS55_38975 [Myxococcus stipitatus]|uniref:hypothetical protein n=1 Tax=Myxococcus stipitatus TaxID=83455 RepID=UPI0031454707
MTDETSPEERRTLERAEDQVFRVIERDLERQQTPDAVLYLKYLLMARPEGVERKAGYKRVRFGMYQRTSEYVARYSPITGEQCSWVFSAFAERCGAGLGKAEALELATQAAAPPEDAVLEVADYEVQGGERVFVARWGHVVDGVRVERDYIQVLVNGELGRVFAVHRRWHPVDAEFSWR